MRLRWRDEDGIALVVVMLSTLAILSLVAASMAYGLGSESNSRHDQDWNAALAAANAGIDDYIYRIDQDHNYWLYSATNSPPDSNYAFISWVPVAGGSSQSFFRYTPDPSTTKVDGTVKLTVSGKVNGTIRTIRTTLRRRTFIDYLYFTDYETLDPALYTGSPFTPTTAQMACAKHYYEGRDPACTVIYFFSRDTINGPLHSNDAININGTPQFRGDTSTSWNDPANMRWLGTGTPSFLHPDDPKWLAALTLPPSNSAIKAETDPSIPGATGCLFTGPTLITMNNGTMTVVSPFTKSSNCYTGTNRPYPSNGVIYVQNVPATPSDPNYTNGCPYAGGYPPGLPVPIALDVTPYNCRDGDVFISGTLKGQLTIAAEHNVEIMGHTKYNSGVAGSDLLGLVANNYVEVMHPVRCTTVSGGQCTAWSNLNIGSTTFTNPIIQAAILSVQHSFQVQNYRAGTSLGNLNVTGAISQKYRGIVGTFSGNTSVSGYIKNYVYDQRLKYLEPPHFIDPVASAWQVVTWSELPSTATP